MFAQLAFAGSQAGLASFSPCGLYRWWLRRKLQPAGGVVCFVLCYPVTADAALNDATTSSCMRLARRWGAGEIVLVNLFAFRSTSPAALECVIRKDGLSKAVGDGNEAHVRTAAKGADKVVVGWGSILKPWSTEVGERVRWDLAGLQSGLWCVGKNRDGAPRHPLYVPAATELKRWP